MRREAGPQTAEQTDAEAAQAAAMMSARLQPGSKGFRTARMEVRSATSSSGRAMEGKRWVCLWVSIWVTAMPACCNFSIWARASRATSSC